MSNDDLKLLCAAAIADTPHADLADTLGTLRYLSPDNREQAAKCYAAIIGERTLPVSFGAKHTLPPRQIKRHDTEQVRRNGVARRELEARRELLQRD